MTGIILIALVIGLAGFVALSLYMNSRPMNFGETRLVPWIPLGLFAAAADFVLLAYAISYFGNA